MLAFRATITLIEMQKDFSAHRNLNIGKIILLLALSRKRKITATLPGMSFITKKVLAEFLLAIY